MTPQAPRKASLKAPLHLRRRSPDIWMPWTLAKSCSRPEATNPHGESRGRAGVLSDPRIQCLPPLSLEEDTQRFRGKRPAPPGPVHTTGHVPLPSGSTAPRRPAAYAPCAHPRLDLHLRVGAQALPLQVHRRPVSWMVGHEGRQVPRVRSLLVNTEGTGIPDLDAGLVTTSGEERCALPAAGPSGARDRLTPRSCRLPARTAPGGRCRHRRGLWTGVPSPLHRLVWQARRCPTSPGPGDQPPVQFPGRERFCRREGQTSASDRTAPTQTVRRRWPAATGWNTDGAATDA